MSTKAGRITGYAVCSKVKIILPSNSTLVHWKRDQSNGKTKFSWNENLEGPYKRKGFGFSAARSHLRNLTIFPLVLRSVFLFFAVLVNISPDPRKKTLDQLS